MTRRTRLLLPAAVLLSTALLATGCAGGGGGDSADSPPPESPTASPPVSPPVSPPASPLPAQPVPAPAPATGPATPPQETLPATLWHPAPGTTWQWQLSGTVDQSVAAAVFDIDGFENSASTVAALHAKGHRVVCYVNAGAWEDFRPDAGDFPPAVRGAGNGWAGEKWLDIRRIDTLRPLLAKRFDMCRSKGFDAVEPDLVDAYANTSGFPLTAADQLAYNRMIAGLAHERGLAVALKNDLDQIPELVDAFDFAVDEQCAEFDECAQLTPFIKAGKAVLHAEYNLPPSQFCARSAQLGLSSIAKHLGLDSWRQSC